jgi:hypothetical protein
MVDRQAEMHAREILSRQGKGSAVRYRSEIPSESCYREGLGRRLMGNEGAAPFFRAAVDTADEDKLRELAIAGTSSRAIGVHMTAAVRVLPS